MISVADNTITTNGVTSPIKTWQVWWRCPWGLSPDREELVAKCLSNDVDPEINVIPVPTAILDSKEYEPYLR